MEFPEQFKQLVDKDQPTGEVVAVNRFLAKVKGLQPISINSLVMFSDGEKGIVREIEEDSVTILTLGQSPVTVGTIVVKQHHELVAKVGENYIGRVVSATGRPLDGKGSIVAEAARPVFAEAPRLIDRSLLDTQLPTGVTVVDTLFPLALGQRIAVLGDSKSGKSTFISQVGSSQANTDRITIYVMIAKRQSEVDTLIRHLEKSGGMKNSIVVVSSIFDSLIESYLAPYIGCTIAEYLWKEKNRDVIIFYDDLTAHANVYREISLLAEVSPGRDSYPGDMFYAHSSLLERAGKLSTNGKSLTSIPLVLVPGGDITTYLPTNIMSITDGQIIFDTELIHEGLRPAINVGLSVSRIGGRVQTKSQKQVAGSVFKRLAQFREAAEFSHFGSELALEAQSDLEIGRRLREAMKQKPEELYSPTSQVLMLDAILSVDANVTLDIAKLKSLAAQEAPNVTDESQVKPAVQKLIEAATIEVKK